MHDISPDELNAKGRAYAHHYAKNARGINRRKLTPEQRAADLAGYVQEQAAYLKTKSVLYAVRLVTR